MKTFTPFQNLPAEVNLKSEFLEKSVTAELGNESSEDVVKVSLIPT